MEEQKVETTLGRKKRVTIIDKEEDTFLVYPEMSAKEVEELFYSVTRGIGVENLAYKLTHTHIQRRSKEGYKNLCFPFQFVPYFTNVSEIDNYIKYFSELGYDVYFNRNDMKVIIRW